MLIRDSDDGGFGYGWMLVADLFDLARVQGVTTWSCSKTTSRLVYSIELSAPGQSGVNRKGKEHAEKVGAEDNRQHDQFPEADGDCHDHHRE
jgi:hypothetical protein